MSAIYFIVDVSYIFWYYNAISNMALYGNMLICSTNISILYLKGLQMPGSHNMFEISLLFLH